MVESPGPELRKGSRPSCDGRDDRGKDPGSTAAKKKKKRKEKKLKRTKKRSKKRVTNALKERKKGQTQKRRGCNGLGLWANMGFSEVVRANHKEYQLLSRPPSRPGGDNSTACKAKAAAPGAAAATVSGISETQAAREDASQSRGFEVSTALLREPSGTEGRERGEEVEPRLGKKRMREEYDVGGSVRTTIQERITERRKSMSDLERMQRVKPRRRVSFALPVAVATGQMGNQPTTPTVGRRSEGRRSRGAGPRKLGTTELYVGTARNRDEATATELG